MPQNETPDHLLDETAAALKRRQELRDTKNPYARLVKGLTSVFSSAVLNDKAQSFFESTAA